MTTPPDPSKKSAIGEAFAEDFEATQFQDVGQMYKFGKRLGLDYGSHFQRVDAWRVLSGKTADVILKSDEDAVQENVCIDSADADAVFHGLLPLLQMTQEFSGDLGFIPVHCESVQLFKPGEKIAYGRIALQRVGTRNVKADCTYLNASKEPIAVLSGLRLQAIKLVDDLAFDKHLFRMTREPLIDLSANAADPQNGISVSVLSQAVNSLCSSFAASPQDEENAWVETVAVSIAYEAISELCDENQTLSLAADELSG